MFDTMKVANKIRNARIAQNLTQMNLADAMGVSYQAVSNWERGNSMPDISKLQQLCEILHISLDELLESQAKTVQKVFDREAGNSSEPISLDEIRDVIPILPPEEAGSLIEENVQEKEKLDLNAITSIAPFLDEEYLDSLLERAQVTSLSEITGIAPFLSDEALDRLAMKATSFQGLVSVAPFLSYETLDKIVAKKLASGDTGSMSSLYPFLSSETLRKIAEVMMKHGNLSELQSLLPFC